MKKSTVMTEGVIWKEILFFSIPLILGNLFQQLYNTVDSIIVGNYIGSEALAAVGSSSSIINLLIGFCIGASAGAGVVISQFYGAGDKNGLRKAVHTTVAISIAAGVILTVAGILNAVGNSRRSLVYLMIAAFSNIVLDILFVIVLKMGIVGAALATDISQLLSCVFIILYLVKSKEVYHVNIKEIRFYDNLLSKIIRIGLPTGIQNIVISFSNVIVQSSVNSFGAVAMAGFAAYIKIDGFNILPVLSFGMAAATFTGQNVGAGKYDRVKKGMYVSVGMGVVYTILTGILLLTFAPQVIGVFTKNPDVVGYGVYIMRFFCPFYWLLGILQVLSGTIRGAGKTLETMLVFLFSLCILRVAWIWGALAIEHKLDWVMTAYPVSWLVGAVLILLYAWKGNWMPGRRKKDAAMPLSS